ncbi:MAG: ANTAR domain-containing protein [Nitrosomonadales bacterium]|nr:ANTAR domain-containing protein [Nitrosomonadales bacterium]
MKPTVKTNEAPLRVLLVDETFERAALLNQGLRQAGCRIAAHVSSSADITGLVSELMPDVIILDVDSPDRDTLEHLCLISRDQPRPIVMFTHDDDSGKIRDSIRAGVSAYVVDGLNPERLRSIMEVATARFNEFQSMRHDLAQAESRLAERKVVERAKGLLMNTHGYSEPDAYQRMRSMAMSRGKRLVEIADSIILAHELSA